MRVTWLPRLTDRGQFGRPRVPGILIRDGNGYHRNRARWNAKTVCPVGGRSLTVANKDASAPEIASMLRRYAHKLLQALPNCAKMLIFKCFCLLATAQRFAELSITYCFECRLETLLTTVQVCAGLPNTALRYKALSADSVNPEQPIFFEVEGRYRCTATTNSLKKVH